jgi:hypothetical protein
MPRMCSVWRTRGECLEVYGTCCIFNSVRGVTKTARGHVLMDNVTKFSTGRHGRPSYVFDGDQIFG